MKVAEKTHKASVSIRESNWKALSRSANKSKIVNQALALYFDFEEKKQSNYQEWYKGFLEETLEAMDEISMGEGTPVPMKNGKIDRKAFMEEIWN
ncbi:hypothetical protein N9J72_02990 [Candidatus Gracilibacteria bacterium]|nr:hypothetical protein [Candidatus Gracilibacteria bacterium]